MKRSFPFRKATVQFYLALTICLIVVIIIIIQTRSKVPEHHVSSDADLSISVILDAGHGGLDGGAVSPNGTAEAPITLEIARKTQALLRFYGISAVMTRDDDNSLAFDPSASLRDNKNADLRERLNIANQYPESLFISIHLNQFNQAKYHGAQVFYGTENPEAKRLAEMLQKKMVLVLDPENTRVAKRIPGTVYLMERVKSPAVTVECGFLSNPEEEILLQSKDYQRRISIALLAGYVEYQKGS